jgi:hypothetical protein
MALVMIATKIQAQQISAADADSARAPVAKVVPLSGSLSGTAKSTSGGCTTGFSDRCPTGHLCGCLTATAAKLSSSTFGAGTANFFATIDSSSSFGALGDCAPVFVEIDLTAKKDSPTFESVGGLCFEPNGDAVLNGVMGLSSSSLFADSGSAGYQATLHSASGLSGGDSRMKLSFKGAAK